MTEADFDDAERFEAKPADESPAPHQHGSWKIELFQERRTGDWYQVCRGKRAWRNVGKQTAPQSTPRWQTLE